MLVKKQGKYRFDEFEVDLATRSLKRDGRFVAISPKTFDLLSVFVTHPGRLITQEELLHALWPNATMEESNLGQHIFLLRKALAGYQPGENFLSAIPRKGYQFSAVVTAVPEVVSEVAGEAAEPVEIPASIPPHKTEVSATSFLRNPIEATIEEPDLPRPHAVVEEAESSYEQARPRRRRPRFRGPWMMTAAAGLVVLLAVGGLLAWRRMHASTPASVGLVVGDFQNSTGHHELDNSLRTALIADLEQSPYLRVASPLKVERILDPISPATGSNAAVKPAADPMLTQDAQLVQEAVFAPSATAPPPLSAGRARESCHLLDDQAYLTGSIKRLALKYLVTVEAFDCDAGHRLAQSRGIADSPDGILAVLPKVAADLRKQLGEPLPSVERFSKPLFAGGSSTATATEVYAEGLGLIVQGRPDEAAPMLERATELDPQFALAFGALGETYSSLGKHNLATSNISKAYELRNLLDDQHRLALTSLYYDTVTGDLNASIRNDREWIGLYPRDPAPYSDLADLQIQLGKPALALDPARKALEFDPENPLAYVTLARAQMHTGQFEEAAATCRQAISRHMDVAPIHNFLLQIAFLRLDQPAMDEQFEWARNRPSEPYMMLQQALIDFALGKVKAAQTVMADVVAAYRRQGENDRANRMQAQVPRIEAELGMVETASNLLQRLPAISGSTDIPVAWAEVGETARAESLRSAELDAHPAATVWQEYDGPQISAAIDMNQHRPEAAVEALETATRYDLRSLEVPALRGRALLAAKQPAFAEAEFQHILDHPGIEPFSHNYPLARLGLARALAAQDKTVDAGFAYKILFSMWKDADPTLPRLLEAKAEYAKLIAAAAHPASASHPAIASHATASSRPVTPLRPGSSTAKPSALSKPHPAAALPH